MIKTRKFFHFVMIVIINLIFSACGNEPQLCNDVKWVNRITPTPCSSIDLQLDLTKCSAFPIDRLEYSLGSSGPFISEVGTIDDVFLPNKDKGVTVYIHYISNDKIVGYPKLDIPYVKDPTKNENCELLSPELTNTDSPNSTVSPSPTLTFTPSPTLTPPPSPTLTFTPSPTLTPPPSPTLTFTPLPTLTPTPTLTPITMPFFPPLTIENCEGMNKLPQNCQSEGDPNTSDENDWVIRWKPWTPPVNISSNWFYLIRFFPTGSNDPFKILQSYPELDDEPANWKIYTLDIAQDLPPPDKHQTYSCGPYWDVVVVTSDALCPTGYANPSTNNFCLMTLPPDKRALGTIHPDQSQEKCPAPGSGSEKGQPVFN